jgi:hypothetical protein
MRHASKEGREVRIHGFCQKCHKYKVITVSRQQLVKASRGIPIGICASCEEVKR